MGFEPKKVGDDPEVGLAVMVRSGVFQIIPLGAVMQVLVDPKNPERIIPVVLKDITNRAIVFRCACGQKNCTRVLRYVLKNEGVHPQIRRSGATQGS